METRWRRLIDAGIAVTSELSLDGVLQRILDASAELTSARYAALGVIGPSGRSLERFLTTGIDEETFELIGDLPQGRGILGALIVDAHPLRLHDLTADPRSVGFPPHHPPMRTFLGVPILLRSVAYGNLYLAEKAGGDFTAEDEEIVTLLAAQAAVAIENARLYESATRWLAQLESLNEVGNALADRDRARAAARADRRPAPRPDRSRNGPDHAPPRAGRAAHRGGRRPPGGGAARHTPRAWRLEERTACSSGGAASASTRRSTTARSTATSPGRIGMRSGLFVPHDRGRAIDRRDRGAQQARRRPAVHGRGPAARRDLRRRAAVAVDLSDRVARDALRRVVEAQELERRRLARELHDETGQALTSILLGLKRGRGGSITRRRPRRPRRSCRAEIVGTLQAVRRSPSSCDPRRSTTSGSCRRSSGSRRRSAASRGSGSTSRRTSATTRLPAEVETALYRIVQEALTNVVEARAGRARRASSSGDAPDR